MKTFASPTKAADYAIKHNRTFLAKIPGIDGIFKVFPWGEVRWRPECRCPTVTSRRVRR